MQISPSIEVIVIIGIIIFDLLFLISVVHEFSVCDIIIAENLIRM